MRARIAIGGACVCSATLVAAARDGHGPLSSPESAIDGAALVRVLRCGSCHEGLPDAAAGADSSLASHVAAIDVAQVAAYLREPPPPASEGAPRMPAFHFDDGEALALARFLAAASAGATHAAGAVERRINASTAAERTALVERFTRVARANPSLTSERGARIYRAEGCASCHALAGTVAWRTGPDLSAEGSRVRADWLARWLQTPTAVRPFGAAPGTGSRMPDYRLTVGESRAIASYLSSRTRTLPAAPAQTITRFERDKAALLLRDRLPCLGCHTLDGGGGRVGPDLSRAAERLQPAFVYAMIGDPQHTVRGSVMPKTPMPAATLQLIAAYILASRTSDAPPPYLSLVETPLVFPGSVSGDAATYERYCAHCHGALGHGDGFNARYLPVAPTAHASAPYMSSRSDDTIFDAVHSGGYILGRSNRMPAFGATLDRAQIRGLVRHIRRLCSCEGPSWSRDGETVR